MDMLLQKDGILLLDLEVLITKNLVQLLPNPYRNHDYFNGGVIYEIPSGDDKFELEVSPPFGEDTIILYASSSPLGNIELDAVGGIYAVKTKPEDVGVRTRGVVIKQKDINNSQKVTAEFSETSIEVKTVGE